jgi:hypothetical protein
MALDGRGASFSGVRDRGLDRERFRLSGSVKDIATGSTLAVGAELSCPVAADWGAE